MHNPVSTETAPKSESDVSYAHWYRSKAVEFGLQHYVSGRYATWANFPSVGPALLHHAVELLLKACLSRDDSVQQIGRYRDSYRQDLSKLWLEYKARYGAGGLGGHDEVIAELHRFQNVRSLDRLVHEGEGVTIAPLEVPSAPSEDRPDGRRDPKYALSLPAIDRLVAMLFDATTIKLERFESMLNREHAMTYYMLGNTSPLK